MNSYVLAPPVEPSTSIHDRWPFTIRTAAKPTLPSQSPKSPSAGHRLIWVGVILGFAGVAAYVVLPHSSEEMNPGAPQLEEKAAYIWDGFYRVALTRSPTPTAKIVS